MEEEITADIVRKLRFAGNKEEANRLVKLHLKRKSEAVAIEKERLKKELDNENSRLYRLKIKNEKERKNKKAEGFIEDSKQKKEK